MLGLRPGEATGLAWPDVDFDAEVIHVRRSLKLHNGQLEVTERLKTSRSRRSLDVGVVAPLIGRQHVALPLEAQQFRLVLLEVRLAGVGRSRLDGRRGLQSPRGPRR
jgi:integrase